MRGLKHERNRDEKQLDTSHLLQMRGLKQYGDVKKLTPLQVASFTDAWIETYNPVELKNGNMSHLLQMRGLKQRKAMVRDIYISRIFYRCVD